MKEALRMAVQGQLRAMVGSRGPRSAPSGVPMFSADAVCRRVHGDFTSMMVGGVSALLLQMLHPGALAGVWDHSNFRKDMQGRLRRTANFISATTYGSEAEVQLAIDRVRAVHSKVRGVLPDGTPYSADDPELLTWVHIAGSLSFLQAYLQYKETLSRKEQDRYFAETATIARRLGAHDVPETADDAQAYLRSVRTQLRADERTAKVVNIVLNAPPHNWAAAPLQKLILLSGVDLLPDWARQMHGLSLGPLGRPVARLGTAGAAGFARWALRTG